MVLTVTKAHLNIGSSISHHGSADAECSTELRRASASSSDLARSQPHYTPLSAREALLFRNFVDNMALWVCVPSNIRFPACSALYMLTYS
jgi:hypothetical protein